MIDEAELLPSQIKTFCEALLGCPSLPEPELWTRWRFLLASTKR